MLRALYFGLRVWGSEFRVEVRGVLAELTHLGHGCTVRTKVVIAQSMGTSKGLSKADGMDSDEGLMSKILASG